MPSTETITAYNTFAAGTKIMSSQVNANFTNHRGHQLPINVDTATAADDTWDLGGDTYRWRNAYLRKVDLRTSTSTATLTLEGDTSATTGAFVFKIEGVEKFRVSASGITQPLLSIATKTTTYTLTSTDDVILADASGGSFTLTLPAAAGVSGKIYYIQKTAGSLTQTVTIAGTIGGFTNRKLTFADELIVLYSNGTDYDIIGRYLPKTWTSFTPTGTWSTNVSYTGKLRPLGGNLVRFQFMVAASGAPTASTALIFTVPNSWNVDEADLLIGSDDFDAEVHVPVSAGAIVDKDTGNKYFLDSIYRGTSTQIYPQAQAASSTYVGTSNILNNAPITFASGDEVQFVVDLPISEIDE